MDKDRRYAYLTDAEMAARAKRTGRQRRYKDLVCNHIKPGERFRFPADMKDNDDTIHVYAGLEGEFVRCSLEQSIWWVTYRAFTANGETKTGKFGVARFAELLGLGAK